MSRKIKRLLSPLSLARRRNFLNRPLQNKLAIGAKDILFAVYITIIVVTLSVYYLATIEHETTKMGLTSEANSLVDVISENRKITPEIHEHYCDNVEMYGFYVSDYKITYKIYNVTESGITLSGSPKVVNKGGNFGSPITVHKGDIIRVEISSLNETFLTRATKFVGGSGTADVVGFAEGGVD